MRAELVGIDAGRPRWRFTLGCLRVVATRPAVWRYAGYGVLLVGAVAATVRWTGQVGYGPLRVVLVGTVAALVVVAVLGRVRPLGPVAHSRAGRGVRAFGYVLVGALAAEEVAFFAHQNRSSVDGEQVLAVMFVVLLLGFLALTAQRSSVTSTTLIVGVLAGCAAAAGWTAVVVVSPPIPPDVGLAILVTALAIGAAVLAANRGVAPGRGCSPARAGGRWPRC